MEYHAANKTCIFEDYLVIQGNKCLFPCPHSLSFPALPTSAGTCLGPTFLPKDSTIQSSLSHLLVANFFLMRPLRKSNENL